MRNKMKSWQHVFKLDPDKTLSDDALEQICLSGTDAVIVGGSTGVTFDNTVDLLGRIRRYELPCVLEISNIEAIVPGFDLYFVPVVLNAGDVQWIAGQHRRGLSQFGSLLDWNTLIPEGYVVMNAQSAVAKLTRADTCLTQIDLLSYAKMADKLFKLPIFYIEYSGAFGNLEWVKQAKHVLDHARLFYGGGIDSLDKAQLAAQAADTIVVGNVIYQDLKNALETVKVTTRVEADL